MKKNFKKLVILTLALALALTLLPAAALAAEQDEAQSVGISVSAEKIELAQPDGTKTVLPAAKNVSLRQGGKGDLRGMLGDAGRGLNTEDSQPWDVSVWRNIYDGAVAAGLATPNETLEAYFDSPEADAGQLICMVLETLGTDGLPTTEFTAPAGGKLQSADGSEAGEIPANAKVSALGFCVDGRAAVLVDGVLRFLPVESLRTADGEAAGEELQWVATKPCGYYDEKAGTAVVVLPNGVDCELNGDLDSLTVESSVQGDVTLENANIGKAYHFGEGSFIAKSGAKINSVETTDKSKVVEDGGSVGSVKQVEKLRVTLPGGTGTIPADENIWVNVAANARGVRWSVSNPSVLRIGSLQETTEQDAEAHSNVKVCSISVGGSLVTARANGQRASVWLAAKPHAQEMGFMRKPGVKIKVGETIPLIYGFSPSGSYTGYQVIWETSDPAVAMVAGVGFDGLTEEQRELYGDYLKGRPDMTVLGVGEGTATITARTRDGRLSASYVVTVEEVTLPNKLSMRNQNGERIDNLTLLKGETYTLTADDGVSEVDYFNDLGSNEPSSIFELKKISAKTYMVYAKNAGFGAIGYLDSDNPDNYYNTKREVVFIGVADPLPEKLELWEGESYALDAIWLSGIGDLQNTDDSVAAIRSENGGGDDTTYYLEAKKPGTTTVSLWGWEGVGVSKYPRKLSECRVTVKPVAQSVTLDKNTASLVAGGYERLTATALPAGAASGVEWTTSNPAVATVDENGGVTAIAPGSAKITAKTVRGGYAAACDISVRAAVGSLALNETNLKIYTGDTFRLQPTVLPAEANQQVTYSGNDERVATVGSDGTITAKGPGRMMVTARTEDIPGKDGMIRGKFAQCFVTVTDYVAVTNIDMKDTASVEAKKTITLNAQVMPASASVKGVTWSSGNTAVATVSNGVVTGVAEGTAVITATSVDNSSITASCTVKVIPEGGVPVQSVVVTSSGWPNGYPNPYPGDSTTLTATVTPSGAAYDKITWTVEGGDPGEGEVIRITPTGKSTATLEVLKQGSGSCFIRATAGGVTSEYADSFVISTIEAPPVITQE